MLLRRPQLVLLAPLVAVLVPFLLWPAALGFAASLTSYAPNVAAVRFVGLRNYAMVLRDPTFRGALGTALLYTLVTVPAALALGLLIAALLRQPFRGRGAVRVALLTPWLLSPVAHGVLWHFLLSSVNGLPNVGLALLGLPAQPSPLGLRSWALPVTMAAALWRTAPFAGFLLLPGLEAVPSTLWDQAALEGLPWHQTIQHVVLPCLRPLLLAVGLLLCGDALGTFDTLLILTGGGPGTATLMPALYSYRQAYVARNWPVGTAAAWLLALLMLLLGAGYLLLRRQGSVDTDDPPGQTLQHPRPRSWPQRACLALLLLLALFPLAWTLLASLGMTPDLAVRPPVLRLPPSLAAYREVGVAEPRFWATLTTSLLVAVLATAITMSVGVPAAYALTRPPWRDRPMLAHVMLILASLPAMAYILSLGSIVRVLRLADTLPGVVLAQAAVVAPLATYVLVGYFAQLPQALEEAALLEGATSGQLLRRVALPLAAPGLAATAIIVFVLQWNQLLVPLVVASTAVRTLPVAMIDFFSFERELEWPVAAAALLVSFMPVLLIVAAAHRLVTQFKLGSDSAAISVRRRS